MINKMMFFVFFTLSLLSCQSKKISNNEIISIENTELEIKEVEQIFYYDLNLFLSTSKKLFKVDVPKKTLQKIDFPFDNIRNYMKHDESILFKTNDGSIHKFLGISDSRINSKLVCEGADSICLSSYVYESKFKDERYDISSCCLGEFGGSVFFTNKSDGRIFTTPSTCVIQIEKFNDEYYIFNYLGHLVSSSSIIKVGEVEELPEIKIDTFGYWCNWYAKKYVGITYSQYDSLNMALLGNTKANAIIFDTTRLKILTGSVDEDKINITYHTDYTIESGQIENGVILNERILFLSEPKIANVISSLAISESVFGVFIYDEKTNIVKLNVVIANEEGEVDKIYGIKKR